MQFGENRPFLLLPCQEHFEKFFFSKINNISKTDQFEHFWDFLKKCFWQFLKQFLRNFDLNQKADL
jgi:hypothetical protein